MAADSPVTAPDDQKRGARTVVGTFVLQLRPVRVPAAAIRFTHTFGLGGASLVLLVLLAVTGSLLMFAYTPVPGDAYASIERLEGEVLFGAFVRAVEGSVTGVIGLPLDETLALLRRAGYPLPWEVA